VEERGKGKSGACILDGIDFPCNLYNDHCCIILPIKESRCSIFNFLNIESEVISVYRKPGFIHFTSEQMFSSSC
jgi:hypothetical protein